MRALIWCLVYFVFFGPMVGFIAAATLVAAFNPDASSIGGFESVSLAVLFAATVSIPLLPALVLVGGLPALVTGSIYWAWRRRVYLPPWQSAVIAGVTGGGVCAVIVVAIEGTVSSLAGVDVWQIFILPGAIAGAATGWLVDRRLQTRLAMRIEAPADKQEDLGAIP